MTSPALQNEFERLHPTPRFLDARETEAFFRGEPALRRPIECEIERETEAFFRGEPMRQHPLPRGARLVIVLFAIATALIIGAYSYVSYLAPYPQ